MKAEIIVIVAMGKHGQIGLNGKLPWHLSDDLKNFKKITTGHTLIMGRKTFDSIGKALPNRLNMVLTSKPEKVLSYDVCLYNDLEKALKKARMFDNEIFIIGGASLYRQTLSIADKLIITHVDYHGKADTFFPEIDWKQWKACDRQKFHKTPKNDYDFEVVSYVKNI